MSRQSYFIQPITNNFYINTKNQKVVKNKNTDVLKMSEKKIVEYAETIGLKLNIKDRKSDNIIYLQKYMAKYSGVSIKI